MYCKTPVKNERKFDLETDFCIKNRDDKIRTCDPRDPNTVRYQAALHPDIVI